MSFYNFLQDKLGQHDPEKVEEIILDDLVKIESLSEDHKTSLEKYKILKHFSANNINLKSLKNFPHLPSLEIVSKTI